MGIVEFLTARLDEDEASAVRADHKMIESRYASGMDMSPDVARLFFHARFDPARVLAEVKAKRAIIQQHSEPHECPAWDAAHGKVTDYVAEEECRTLCALASVHADHADYDPAWAVA